MEEDSDVLGVTGAAPEDSTELSQILDEMDGSINLGYAGEENVAPDEGNEQGEEEEGEEENNEEASASTPFKLLVDKPVAEEIKLFEWCPTMDLLAWITVDNQLIVQRLSWQRLFSIRTHDHPITALTWRPDGKIIAVGHQDGKISLVDVENGTAYYSSQVHSAAVTCLHWTQETNAGSVPSAVTFATRNALSRKPHIHFLKDRTERFLGPLPPPPLLGQTSDGAVNIETAYNAAARMPPPDRLNILVSSDEAGKVILSALGTFCVGMADIRTMTNSQQTLATRVSLAPDFKHLYVAVEGPVDWENLTARGPDIASSFLSPLPNIKSTPPAVSSSSSSCTFGLIDISTSLLWSRRNELKLIAIQSAYISSHLSHIGTTLQLMSEKWSQSFTEFGTRFNDFTNLLRESSSTATVRQELLCFLISGVPSPDLERFLLTTLTEAGVKKLGKGIEAGCSRLEELLNTHLKPATEILLFRLSELQGRAKWYEQFGVIGLEEQSLLFLLQKASLFARRTEELCRILSQVKKKYAAFFNWLLFGTLKLADMLTRRRMQELVPVDEKMVSELLNDDLITDLIAPFFSEEPTPEPEQEGNVSHVLPSPGLRKLPSKFNRPSTSLSFAKRNASSSLPLSSPFMLPSSISPFSGVSPRSALKLGMDPAATPARSHTPSPQLPRGAIPLGSLSAFSTPSPSSIAETPCQHRYSPMSRFANLSQSQFPQLSSISAHSTPASGSGSHGYNSVRGSPMFVEPATAQPSSTAYSSLRQMFSEMATVYEEIFIMPSQTLAKSFCVANAIPLLSFKKQQYPQSEQLTVQKSDATPIPQPKPQMKRERNYWEDDDDEEEQQEVTIDGCMVKDAQENELPNDQPLITDLSSLPNDDAKDINDENPTQIMTAFFTDTFEEEGRDLPNSIVGLHFTAFHSTGPIPSAVQDVGLDDSFSLPSETLALNPNKRLIWLIRKRYRFRARQQLQDFLFHEKRTDECDEEYSIGAIYLPHDGADVMHLSFYDKETLAVLSCSASSTVSDSLDPTLEPPVETVLELISIKDVSFVPLPKRLAIDMDRSNLIQHMLADKSFAPSTVLECRSRQQPVNAAGAAVSGSRGVAAVYMAPKRLIFYDLRDDEEEEAEEEGEEAQGEEEQAEEEAAEDGEDEQHNVDE